MISTQDRQDAIELIDEAVKAGARRGRVCQELGICERTYRRWQQGGSLQSDRRPEAARPTPANALSEAERKRVLDLVCRPEFAGLPPSQIVPALADQGTYLASESSFYRILRAHGLQHRRGRAAAPSKREPRRHQAHGPNQVWVWDITWLPGPVAGTYYYLYLMLDPFSRKVVGWEIFAKGKRSATPSTPGSRNSVLVSTPNGVDTCPLQFLLNSASAYACPAVG